MRDLRGRLRVGAFSLLLVMAGSAGVASAVAAEQSASSPSVDTPSAATSAKHVEGQVGPAPEVVEVEPVPEPSTGLLLCAAGAVALARRRKRAAPRID